MVITIDGAAGVGKTSTAKEVAKRLGYQYFDTGAMYRAVTFFFINQNVNLRSIDEVINSLKSIKLHIDFSSESDMIIFLDEDDISLKIRSQDVTSRVSAVSAIKEVREMMVEIQRSFTKKGNFVVEGRDEGNEVEIAVVNAPDPVVLLAAAMSFNENIDELTIAAALHEKLYSKSLKLTKMPNGIMVPADSEYVLWGRITLDNDDEGPYVDITGTVDDIRQEPVIEIEGVFHRDNPIFHALIPGEAEHKTLMGLPRAPTIKDAVSKVCECLDVHMTEGGCGWLSAVVKINKVNHDDAQKAIMAALEGHKSMKMVTIVDQDIDISDPVRVEWAMATRWQPDKDTIILSNQKGSSLDPSRNEDGTTSKVGFDATIPFGVDKSGFMSVQ